MLGNLFLLGLIALAQGRPQDEQAVVTKCPSGVTNYLIPNERDCSKFYVCSMGRSLVEGVCEPGLEFSIELQRCADPLIAKCNCNTEPETTTIPAPTPAPEPEEEREIIYLPNGCPEDIHIPKLLPHEERCEYFYHCDKGEKVLKECAEGTYFVYEEQTCDHTWKVNCISNGTTTPRPTTTTQSVVEESREVEYLPNGCPADGGYLLLPHETICRKFYYCVNGELVERECGAGTVFNPAIGNCDHPWNVDCEDVVTECICEDGDEDCDGSTTTPIPASTERVESNEKEDSLEKEDSAEKEESNEKDESDEKENSAEKEESSEKDESDEKVDSAEKEESNEKDESDEKVDSTEKPESNEEDESEETIDSTEKPESNEKDESDEKVDSTEKPESNEEDESDEGSGEEEKITTAKPESAENDKSEENNTSCENNDSDEKDDSHECNCDDSEEEEEDQRCKEDCHVPFWAHDSDCDKFWRCVGEEKVLGVCSEGLHFNEETQTCDFICNVGCKRNHVQSTALVEGVKLFLPWNKVDDLFRDSPKMAMKFLKKHK